MSFILNHGSQCFRQYRRSDCWARCNWICAIDATEGFRSVPSDTSIVWPDRGRQSSILRGRWKPRVSRTIASDARRASPDDLFGEVMLCGSMPEYATADIRNLTFLGHAGAGKFTLVESLLARGGAVDNLSSIERRSTVIDFEPEEKHCHHSMFAGMASYDRDGKHINLID